MYLYDTHCHSSDCSRCAISTSRELVRAYHTKGYAGIVLTDHFLRGNTAVDRSLPWEEKMRCYFKAYEEACDEARNLDFDVIFGLEHAYGDGKEVLVYGIDLAFLLENPDLADISLDAFVERVHGCGGIVVQAHPYRQRDYIRMDVGPRFDIVDGIEVYNAGNRPVDGDRRALAESRQIGCLVTSGSDIHNVHSAKLGKAGVVFLHRVRDSASFVDALRKDVCGYMVNGVIVPTIRENDLL